MYIIVLHYGAVYLYINIIKENILDIIFNNDIIAYFLKIPKVSVYLILFQICRDAIIIPVRF